jgi:hypothetical protein
LADFACTTSPAGAASAPLGINRLCLSARRQPRTDAGTGRSCSPYSSAPVCHTSIAAAIAPFAEGRPFFFRQFSVSTWRRSRAHLTFARERTASGYLPRARVTAPPTRTASSNRQTAPPRARNRLLRWVRQTRSLALARPHRRRRASCSHSLGRYRRGNGPMPTLPKHSPALLTEEAYRATWLTARRTKPAGVITTSDPQFMRIVRPGF